MVRTHFGGIQSREMGAIRPDEEKGFVSAAPLFGSNLAQAPLFAQRHGEVGQE